MFAPNTSFNAEPVFDLGKILEFNEGFYDILTSVFVEKLLQLPVAGTYSVTTERFRPDLISYKIYGSEQYKLMLMLYNSLNSYTEVVPGITRSYPSLSSMEAILFDTTVR